MVSVSIALLDFIPVLLFGAAPALLQRDLYGRMTRGACALFAAGTIEATLAGLLKALAVAARRCSRERSSSWAWAILPPGISPSPS